ncbi:MAG: FAD-dependent oxidoreductase [Planctomycetota bacterium]
MNVSRRELLALVAGVPVSALVGCGRQGGFKFDGELLSPDFLTGHRLRDGWRPPEPNDSPVSARVVIVGGGIAGLSAAWRLKRRGVEDVVVLEMSPSPGGTALSGERDGFRFPWGAHYVPVPMRENAHLIELFEEMGVATGKDAKGAPMMTEHSLCREPEERVFSGVWDEGLYPRTGATDEELAEASRFRAEMNEWAARRDERGRRYFCIPTAASAKEPVLGELDSISMAAWMKQRGFVSERLRWLVDYSCRDDYGLTIEQASAWAGIFYFASRLVGDGSDSQAVITWPEGNGRIVDYLAAEAESVRCSHAVCSIVEQDERVAIRCFDTGSSETRDFHAERLIFAAPQFLAPRLITGWATSGRSIASLRYGAWIVANIHLRERPNEEAMMCWDNVFMDSHSLGYVTSTHQLGVDHGPTVLTWYRPLLDSDPRVSRKELMQLTWEDWASVVVSDLQRAHPDIGSLITRVDFMRWGHAMIQPRVGLISSGELDAAQKPLGRIHFAGTDLSGVALMEEAFYHGLRAADEVAGVD